MEELLENNIAQDAQLQAALDEAWSEEDAAEQDIPEPEEEAQEKEDASEPAAQQAQSDRAPEEKTAGTDQPLTFTLKHLDQTRIVDKDGVVRLAQQGLDYERVRAERDQLRAYRKEAGPALDIVQALAEKNGMSSAGYAEHCRKQGLLPAEPGGREAGRQEQADRARRAEMGRFLSAYPGVKPEEIPKDVWAAVKNGENLTAAYAMHRSRELEAALAAERQNRENVRKTTGSLFAADDGIHQSEFDRWWNLDL
ncbi:MAG: hypothetical protein EOM52_07460 [Clostridia bacterium]|nr:hypothetical protein [Clostridia bacterium]